MKDRVLPFLAGMICATGFAAERPLVDCVDPMIGAITLSGYGGHGLGKTFPGAATPFGMVQLSRDTLPVWDLFGCKSGCMVGNPLIPVIATAQEAGLGGVDYAKALDLAVKTTIKLDPRFYPGGTFTIRTRGAASGGRIAAVRLNGRTIETPWITTKDIVSGGVLEIELEH